MPVDVSIVKY